MRLLAIVVALAAACGGGVAAPSPTPTVTATSTPTATVTPSPSPSASPSALTSARGSIAVTRPFASARLVSPVEIAGDASVFEATLQWRVVDSAGRVLAQGTTTASEGAPGRGTFGVSVSFTQPAVDTYATVEVFTRSPRDGTVDEIVRVPVVLSAR